VDLTSEQVQAIREGEPVPIIPPEVGEECVVLRRDIYEKGKDRAADGLPTPLAVSRMMATASEDEDLDFYQQYKR
jgi:hypothetical protein